MPELKDWISWAVVILSVLIPLIGTAVFFVYGGIVKLNQAMQSHDAAMRQIARDEAAREAESVKRDIKDVSNTTLSALNNVDSKLNQVMLSMINAGKK